MFRSPQKLKIHFSPFSMKQTKRFTLEPVVLATHYSLLPEVHHRHTLPGEWLPVGLDYDSDRQLDLLLQGIRIRHVV